MAKVTIVGVGALGSHLVLLLRNITQDITIIDFDRVERKNVSSQFHSKASVGKKKTEALKQTMKFLFGRNLTTISNKLTKDNVDQLLGGSDLIIDCLDNGEARRLVQGYARANDVACLHGALAADGAFGRVVWTDDFVIDDEGSAGAPTCEDGDHLSFITFVSSIMATSAKTFLDSGKQASYQITPSNLIRI